MSSTIAVQCKDVWKEFNTGQSKTLALRGVDLELYLGEMTLMAGPSGCGKTTLLCVIGGLLQNTRGEVEVLGQEVNKLSSRDQILFRRKNLGFVFQQYNLLPSLTAAENVAVPLLASGMKRREAIERSVWLLETLGLGKHTQSVPSTLSGGQQQRVALARGLVHDPRLIVCDEPTSALDAETGHAVMELLSKAAVRSDRAVLVVTHDSRIFNFADRMVFMDDGRITRTETKFKSSPMLEWPAVGGINA